METQDPTIEEIVGEENVIDLHVADEDGPKELPDFTGFHCSNCSVSTQYFSELEAHMAEVHPPKEPAQPELFREPGVVHRMVDVPMSAELLDEKKTRLAALYQSTLEIKETKKNTDASCNARLKDLDEQMQEIARVLKTPFTYEKVDCEWRIINSEHARGLYRIDTGELLEKQPLTAEDRNEEILQAEVANRPLEIGQNIPEVDALLDMVREVTSPEGDTPEVDGGLTEQEFTGRIDEVESESVARDADFINERYKNRKKKKVVPEANGTSE